MLRNGRLLEKVSTGLLVWSPTTNRERGATAIFEPALWKANIDNNLVGKPVKRAMIDKNKSANIDNRRDSLMEVRGPVVKARW